MSKGADGCATQFITPSNCYLFFPGDDKEEFFLLICNFRFQQRLLSISEMCLKSYAFCLLNCAPF